MESRQNIRHLTRQQINDKKWNNCINQANNGLIYCYSFYLDAMATAWDGLVLGDYEAVMPLPFRKKWSVSYLYQPFLTAQLGVFGNGLSEDMFSAFLYAVPKKFQYWDFALNHQNRFPVDGFPLYERMNYVLALSSPYETLYKQYRENIRRNIKKSRDYGCIVKEDISISEIVTLTKFQAKDIPEAGFHSFQKLFAALNEKGMAKTYGIVSKTGELLSSAAFLFSHNRAYYLLVGNHPNGRTLGASHALIDAFVREHAGKNLLLDFEGSDIRNLAFFYSSFGAAEERYAAIRRNRLPWWARWLK